MEPISTDTTPVERPPLHSSQKAILRWFSYDHLEGEARRVSKEFHDLASLLCDGDPMDSTDFPILAGPELTVALRKLLEAKDAAVRAHFAWEDQQ